MPLITFISHDEYETEVEAEVGSSLMQAAVDNGVDGILADCGGACACATCHCYIQAPWGAMVPKAEELEKDMLDCVSEPADNSRLSCQIQVTEEMAGMVVRLPSKQF